MPITIYGTDWCDDTRRTRAFLAARGIRAKFIDIEARPIEARGLSINGRPLSIPVVTFPGGTRLNAPTNETLDAILDQQGLIVATTHRTKLNQELHRFEQYRNDHLVASADFIERNGVIVIVGSNHHEPRDPSLEDDNLQRLTSGLVEIVNSAGMTVDIDIGATAPEPSAPASAPAPSIETTTASVPDVTRPAPLAGSTAAALEPDAPMVEACPLTRQFNELWSSGTDHREAARLAQSEGYSRLAVIKGLHALWEMPLTPEAMALAFNESAVDDLAAMFHVLGWIIEQNPASTMSEFQAFDDATGISVKTQALSLARRPRDTITVVDRMGPGLHLRTIDENRARQMASLTIREDDGLLRIQDQSTLRLSFGWIFLYQSAEFLDTGDYSTMISGNAPLLVDRFTGALWITDTEQRPDAYAENYLTTGNPLVAAAALPEGTS